ncbi:MAG TPA: threonine synthase [candidate division Zixibacteria bacterium]|nr:threonine synthase [candidate division Zixibacteria bacterium]
MGENLKYKLRCIKCGHEFAEDSNPFTCPDCGPFQGTLDVIYPLETLKSKYKGLQFLHRCKPVFESLEDIFPFKSRADLPPIPVGQTPQFKSDKLAKIAGLSELWIKDDGRNPSASFKDRASAVAIAMAHEAGANVIATASTGNAASSLATLAASTSLTTVVFVPRNAPRPKMIQIAIHGAHIIKLDCDYDHAFDFCQEACQKIGWYNRNTAVNPFTGEGKKSAALEIARDLGRVPDSVICPVGDGCIIGSLYKGFSDLLGLGLIDKLPRLYGIQAIGASPLVSAFVMDGEPIILSATETIADSISVGYPRDAAKALRAVRTTGGAMLAVTEEEILLAQRILAQNGGIFVEPAAAASYAGLLKLTESGQIDKDETTVVLLTGHGLKDIEAAATNIDTDIELISPDIDSIERKIRKIFK